jgi:hypothetical protein
MVVAFGVVVIVRSVCRFWITFESAAGSQLFTFWANAPISLLPLAFVQSNRVPYGLGNTYIYGMWVWGAGQTHGTVEKRGRIAKGTLPFSRLGLTNVRKKAGMRGAALGIMLAGLIQAQLAIDG